MGKTSICQRFVNNTYTNDKIPTTGCDFFLKTMHIDGCGVKLTLWDTAGQERFKSLTASYYKNADAAALIYDLTDHRTFETLPMWIEEVNRYAPENRELILIGNKCDVPESEHRVTAEERRALIEEYKIVGHVMCSAKLDLNVTEAFERLILEVWKRPKIQRQAQSLIQSDPNGGRRGIDVTEETSTNDGRCAC